MTPTLPGEALLELDGVDFAWSSNAPAVLRGCSLTLHAGDFLALAGPNGVGKSTLLALACGCLRPGAGDVRLQGRALSAWRPEDAARVLAVLPQRDHAPAGLTVLEAVLLGRSPHLTGWFRFEREEDRRIAHEALEKCGVASLAGRPIGQVSGGERRLVGLARALAQQPRVLLLDEPAAALDLRHQQEVFRLLRRLHRDEGLTILAITHDLNLAALACNRMALLHGGRCVADGPPASLLRADVLEPVYGAQLQFLPSPDGPPFVALRP